MEKAHRSGGGAAAAGFKSACLPPTKSPTHTRSAKQKEAGAKEVCLPATEKSTARPACCKQKARECAVAWMHRICRWNDTQKQQANRGHAPRHRTPLFWVATNLLGMAKSTCDRAPDCENRGGWAEGPDASECMTDAR